MKLLSAAVALVCAFGLSTVADAQLTAVTASSIKMGGTPISVGTVTFAPVNANGKPIEFVGGSSLNSSAGLSCAIVAGAIRQPCQIPDAALTIPANVSYSVQVMNTLTQRAFVFSAVPGITGSTWALDDYAPPAQTTNVQPILLSYGTAAAPSPCATPSVYIRNFSGGQFYICVGGTPVLITSSGGGSGLTSFTTGNLAPLFTASLGSTPTITPALAFTLSNAAANSVFGNFTGVSAAPGYSATPVFSAALLTNFPTFNQSTTGNAATATVATSALAAPYSGLTGTVPTWNQNTAGNAATATNMPYSGLTGTVPTWNQNTTGTASNITGVLTAGSEPAHTGDATNTAGSLAMTVKAINGVALSGLGTGILKNTTVTGVPSIAIASDFPTLNQSTTGNSANITGVLGSGSMPTFTGDVTNSGLAMTVGKLNGTSLAGLTTGLLKNTTTTGVPSIATPGTDYLTPSGSSAALSVATTGAFGVVKPDGTSITISGGVISAVSGGGGTVTTVGDLSPIFTVTSHTSTPTFVLTASAAHTFLGNNTGSSAAPAYVQPAFTDLSGSIAAGQLPAFTGDMTSSAGSVATTVVKINGTSLAGLATGILKNTTTTGVPSIAIASDFPTLNQSTTGTAGNITGVLNATSFPAMTGDVTNTSGSVATTVGKINGVSLAGLATGLLKNTTTTGAPSIAVAGTDYLTPTGSSAGLSVGSATAFGVLKVDGTSCTTSAGVLSCSGSGSGITALTGDVTASGTGSVAATVVKINGTSLAGLATGILKNTTTTGVPSIAVAADFPTLNQSTTGTASNITGVLTAGSEPAHTGDVTNTAGSLAMTVGKINGTSMAGLATGILKNTTTTGVPSIAIAADFPTLNQSTTGSAATLTTARTIAGTSFNGSANVSLANKFIVQGTTDAGLSSAQFLGALATGLVKNTTTTGVLSIAATTDLETPLAGLTGCGTSGNVFTAAGSSVFTCIAPIANATITGPTSAIAANTCTTAATVTMTGVTTSMAFTFAFATSPVAVMGWGANGGLSLALWPSASNTLSWSVCNQTASSITPGAMTFNVGAK